MDFMKSEEKNKFDTEMERFNNGKKIEFYFSTPSKYEERKNF